MNRRLRPQVLKCHDEVVFMHKVRGCLAFDNSAKKTRLLHGFNLALLGVVLCTTLLAGSKPIQNPVVTDSSTVKRTELLSYEGQWQAYAANGQSFRFQFRREKKIPPSTRIIAP